MTFPWYQIPMVIVFVQTLTKIWQSIYRPSFTVFADCKSYLTIQAYFTLAWICSWKTGRENWPILTKFSNEPVIQSGNLDCTATVQGLEESYSITRHEQYIIEQIITSQSMEFYIQVTAQGKSEPWSEKIFNPL